MCAFGGIRCAWTKMRVKVFKRLASHGNYDWVQKWHKLLIINIIDNKILFLLKRFVTSPFDCPFQLVCKKKRTNLRLDRALLVRVWDFLLKSCKAQQMFGVVFVFHLHKFSSSFVVNFSLIKNSFVLNNSTVGSIINFWCEHIRAISDAKCCWRSNDKNKNTKNTYVHICTHRNPLH